MQLSLYLCCAAAAFSGFDLSVSTLSTAGTLKPLT
jgi:hypothetical protein